jgi:hypothetical protein
MSPAEWAGLAVSVTTLLGVVGVVARRIIKSLVQDYLSELKPNGGSSMKDKIGDINNKVDKLEARIDEIYQFLIKR